MDTAEDMRKHLNARPHDGTPNARLKGATQILKLTPPRGGRIGLCVADHARRRSILRFNSRPPRERANWSRVNAIRNTTSTHTPLCGGVNTASGRVQAPGRFNSRPRMGTNPILHREHHPCYYYNSRSSMERITSSISAVCTCARPDTTSTPAFSLGDYPTTSSLPHGMS